MKLQLFSVLLAILLITSASAYYCIDAVEDNDAVKDFKYKTNLAALKNDVENNNINQEIYNFKIKYFNPCKQW